MIGRFCSPIWFGILLVSCDRPAETTSTEEKLRTLPPRITKSDRSSMDDLPATPERLRASMRAADEIESPTERNKALSEVVWDSLELDPELAKEGFQQLVPGSVEKNRLIQHYAMRMAGVALDEAILWATTLETDQEKSLAFDNIALVLAGTEPEQAARMLSDTGVAGRDFDVAVVQVVQRWATLSPQNAASWVVLFGPGEVRLAGLKEIASVWSRSDPQGAVEWIGSLEDQTIQQEAVTGMALSILEQPEATQDELLRYATPEIQSRLESLKAEAEAGEEE